MLQNRKKIVFLQSKFNVMIVMDGILVTSGNRFLIAISTITPPRTAVLFS